jgi:hypothetical protein
VQPAEVVPQTPSRFTSRPIARAALPARRTMLRSLDAIDARVIDVHARA